MNNNKIVLLMAFGVGPLLLREGTSSVQDVGEMRLRVLGLPQAQGSKKLVGRAIVESNANLRPWRSHVTDAMHQNLPSDWPISEVYMVSMSFYFPRPKGQVKPNGSLRNNAEAVKASRPDLDKLVRAVLDSGTDAGVWRDDCQVWAIGASKHYTLKEAGVEIVIKAARNVED